MLIESLIGLILFSFIMETIDSGIGMLYGTILSPILILAGYEPIMVVPSILISQAIGGFIATFKHHEYKNADLKSSDTHIALVIIGLGVVSVIAGAYIGNIIDSFYLKLYIGMLCILMGSIVVLKKQFKFSWNKISIIGAISAFNKALSGGGFGPIVATGNIASGVEAKKAIAITDFAEAPICIMSFLAWVYFNNFTFPNSDLMTPLIIGSIFGGWLGPGLLAKSKSKRTLTILVGTLAIVSGLYMVYKLFM